MSFVVDSDSFRQIKAIVLSACFRQGLTHLYLYCVRDQGFFLLELRTLKES